MLCFTLPLYHRVCSNLPLYHRVCSTLPLYHRVQVRLQQNVTLNSGLLERLSSLRSRLRHGLATLDSLRQRLAGAVSTAANHTFTQGRRMGRHLHKG